MYEIYVQTTELLTASVALSDREMNDIASDQIKLAQKNKNTISVSIKVVDGGEVINEFHWGK